MYLKAGGGLTQVNFREKCTFGGLKGWSLNTVMIMSLNTGGVKDRLCCTRSLVRNVQYSPL